MFSCEWEISKNIFFKEHLRATACKTFFSKQNIQELKICNKTTKFEFKLPWANILQNEKNVDLKNAAQL